MANVVKFKINGLSSALNNVYTRVTDLSRNELYSGETLVSDASGNVELDIGTAGSNGQGVIVYGDNYSTGNESTFKSFCGYGLIEGSSLLNYDNIIFLGASIMHECFGGTVNYANNYSALIKDYIGLSGVSFFSKTESGATSSRYITLADEAVSEFSGLTGNTLVFVHGPGNDVTSNRPYSTDANRDNYGLNMEQVFGKLSAAGWDIAYCGVSWRDYTDVPPEDNGSKPYNENIFYPLIEQYCPDWWDSGRGVPVVDLYNFTKATSGDLLDDATHPYNGACETSLNAYVVGCIGRRISNIGHYNYAGKTIVGCASNSVSSVITTDGVGQHWGRSGSFYPDSAGNQTPLHFLTDLDAINSSGRGDTGIAGYSLISSSCTKNSIYTSDSAIHKGYFYLGSSHYSGMTGRVLFCGSRASATGTRYTNFTVDGVTDDVNCEALTPEFVEFPFVVDSNGVINFTWSKKSGSDFCYFSSWELRFD